MLVGNTMNFKNALIFDLLMKVAIQIQAKGAQRIFFFAMCLCACALGWSNFLMSISTIILGLTIFFKDENDKIRLIGKEGYKSFDKSNIQRAYSRMDNFVLFDCGTFRIVV
jgi:hypothetical protein